MEPLTSRESRMHVTVSPELLAALEPLVENSRLLREQHDWRQGGSRTATT